MCRHTLRPLLAALLVALATPAPAAQPVRSLVKLKLDGTPIEGTTLATFGNQVYLLDRDGRMWDFDHREAQGLQKTTSRFSSYPYSTMRRRLGEEFGREFKVSAAGHYIVVHPAGQPDLWTKRFEELYRSFQHYFSVRGFELTDPEFPLVAVVLPGRDDFRRYAQQEGTDLPEGVIGYYSPQTNRVAMYDLGDGRDGDAWSANATTIIHEATHQTAFNTGIHNRFSAPPRWVCEGLGTMFEAPGVWNSRKYTKDKDRINRDRLAGFVRVRKRHKSDTLAQLIANDRMFDTDSDRAYAESWAWTFFLVETRSRDFARYLARTAERPDFENYTEQDRLADFTAVFGTNLRQLDARFLQFMDKL